ncbi:hypothetical protein AVL62_08785 [Serinicoccus chungangensis]|uniref:Putative 3-methyladenine DNA glycosylase n=1 Tax=Serinicoccus chungangensis TaxID=767452 RepID=A0A0W8I1P4_9MICO|nr:DNA-3-methyladenine glycosylase [Serinicoccus chungangensis]KUG51439.1 hypothetical protein AVL62_08785 [Serinicoccus chungangensis]
MDIQIRGSATEVACALLGCLLVRDAAEGRTVLRITETEAYAGGDDPASHAWRGETERTRAMFGRAGLLYVYRAYGAHWACNVVTGTEGIASAVLLRAGEVVEGEALALERRGSLPAHKLASGPGNLARALGITGEDYGTDLLDRESPVWLEPGKPVETISSGPRVGVSRAADVPWRFWITGDGTVSTYRRSPRADAKGVAR